MAKQNIEKLLAGVRAVEARDPEAGLIIRRVVERAEDNWNAHPETDNAPTIVTKLISEDDLQAAADNIGLGGNANVLAFIEVVKALPALPEPEAAVADEAAEQAAEAEAAAARTLVDGCL